MKSSENINKVNAILITEVIGKPAEHLKETLQDITKKISEEKGVKIVNKKVNNPVEMKEHEGFFTSFAEIEVSVDEILYLVMLTFKYMPAHIDIIHPEKISTTNNDFNDILNEITRRLHGYDEIARILQTEKIILENKLREVLGEKMPIPEEVKTSSKPKKHIKKK